MLFVGNETMEVQYRGRLPKNPRLKKCLLIEWVMVFPSRDIKS
jgi:hypothetical protein